MLISGLFFSFSPHSLRKLQQRFLTSPLPAPFGLLSKPSTATPPWKGFNLYEINFVKRPKARPLSPNMDANLKPYVINWLLLVDAMDKNHWFLCGLGASFETFSTAIRASKPPPAFRELLAQAESHELFLRSLHGSNATPPAAFIANSSSPQNFSGQRGRGRSSRGGSNGGRGRGRRPPHCQLCRTNGHYANVCPNLATFVNRAQSTVPTVDANLAQAFHAQCHVSTSNPDWYVDSGATNHMTSSPANVANPTPYAGTGNVTFGNGSQNETTSSSRPM